MPESGHRYESKAKLSAPSCSAPSRTLALGIALVAAWVPSAAAFVSQSPEIQHGCVTVLKPGMVVESVAKNSEGEKAGLLQGDTLLSWSRGDAKGQIESPFDLSEVEMEQEPRGRVTLEGTRGSTKQRWVIGPDKWGILARPDLPPVLLAAYSQGQELANAGKYSDAANQWRAAAAEGPKSSCAWLSAWILFHGANVLADARQWKEADSLYANGINSETNLRQEMTEALLRAWARTYELRADLANAEKYYSQADVEQQVAGSDSLIKADNLNHLGQILLGRGNLEKSAQYVNRALEIYERIAPASLPASACLFNLGNVAFSRGDLAKAEDLYQQSLMIREKLAPASLAVAGSLSNLGNVACSRGDLVKCEDYYLRALEIRERLAPGTFDVAGNLSNLGSVAYYRGDLSKAEEYYLRALVIIEALVPDSLPLASILTNLANLAEERGDLAKAEEYGRRALALNEKLAPSSLAEAASLGTLGAVATERGDLAKGEEYSRRSLEIRQKLAPGSLEMADNLINLGTISDERGDFQKSEEYFLQSLTIREKNAPESLAVGESLISLGTVADERGKHAEARKYLERALTIDEKLAKDSRDTAVALLHLGDQAFDSKDLAGAEAYYEKSLAIYEQVAPHNRDIAELKDNLGIIAYTRGDLTGAEQYHRQALQIWKQLSPASQRYAGSLAALAEIMRKKQRLDESLSLYAEALDVFDGQLANLGGSSDVRAAFRARHADYYTDYADLLVEQKKPELGFQVLERSRARSLLELLAEAHVDIHQGAPPALLDQERLLQATLTAKTNRKISLLEGAHSEKQLAEVNQEIDAVLRQYQDVQGQIRSSSPSYAALTQPQSLSAKQVQEQLLDSDTVLLEYALAEKRSYVFLVTSTSLDAYELPKRADIENSARQVYELLTTRNTWSKGETAVQREERVAKADVEYRKASMALSQMILGPVAGRLGQKRLLIVADGALAYIPFQVLPVPGTNEGEPMVVGHEIVNLPSASVLSLLRKQTNRRKEAPKEVAVFADPVFDKDDSRVAKAKQVATMALAPQTKPLPVLPERMLRSMGDVDDRGTASGLSRLVFSKQEADAVVGTAESGSGMEAVDFEATRDRALSKELGQYRILHFATHGLLDTKHPELSGLVFSLVDGQGNPQNGYLDLADIYNLDLPVDMVVLSACQTALGTEIRGEGLVGMTRGFMYAGAPRVVASLWKVNDASTADLMGHFYRAMLQEHLRPAAALRQAQLQMRKEKQWQDPFYWAAFTIQGEWK